MKDKNGNERCWGYGGKGVTERASCRDMNQGNFDSKEKLGYTRTMTIQEVQRKYVDPLKEGEFKGEDYDWYWHNCNTFTSKLTRTAFGFDYPEGHWMHYG